MTLFIAIVVLAVLFAGAVYVNHNKHKRNRFDVSHVDNTHIELHNAARNTTVRLTLLALFDRPLATDMLVRRFDRADYGERSVTLFANTPIDRRSRRGTTFIPANGKRIELRTSSTRDHLHLYLVYELTPPEGGEHLPRRRVYIHHTFALR